MMPAPQDLLAQFQLILAEYELGDIVDAVPLDGGMFVRPLKLITPECNYVLRGTRFRAAADEFRFQASVMNDAADRGLSCPRVLPDRYGQWNRQINGLSFAVCEYLHGEQPAWSEWCRRLHSEAGFAEQVGTQVSTLHNVLADLAPEGSAELSIDLPPIQFRHLRRIRDDWESRMDRLSATRIAPQSTRRLLLHSRAIIDDHWSWLVQKSDELRIGELPCQIVHGDVSPVNLIPRDTNAWGFIDWDCCHINHRLYDALGDVMIRPPADEPAYHRLNTDTIRRYVRAYCNAGSRRIEQRELDCIAVFCVARQLEDLRQRLDVLPNLSPDCDAHYARLIEIRLSLMDQIRQTPPDEWRC